MARFLFRLQSIPLLAIKRLWAYKRLTLITIFGLTIAVGIYMTVPMYSDGINFRILERRLTNLTENHNRPPFAYLFTYIGAWRGPVNIQTIESADEYIVEDVQRRLGLPAKSITRHFETQLYKMFPDGVADYDESDESLAFVQFASADNIESHVTMRAGRYPEPAGASDRIEVMITLDFANELGLQVGEEYVAFDHRDLDRVQTFAFTVVGIWEPTNRDDTYWPYSQSTYDELLIVPEATLVDHIAPQVNDEINLAAWYLTMDGSEVGPQDADRLVGALIRVERELQNRLPGIDTLITPTDALQLYRQDVSRLNQILFAFNLPTIGLVLAFIWLIGTMLADQRRNELAILRSRGAPIAQLVMSVLVESVILGLIAFGLGTLLSMGLTSWMGRVRSFLDFSAEADIRVVVNAAAIRAGLTAAGIAVLAQILPTLTNVRHTIINYKLSNSRDLQPPWWQRVWLDVILVAVAGYGYYTLQAQGGLYSFAPGDGDASDPFQNPLLFLLPAFMIFSVTLLSLRILPWIMNRMAWLLQFSDSISLLQASRYLARSPRTYTTPLILLVLTVSFAVYTASLAETLDYHIYDQYYYETGADLNFYNTPTTSSPGTFGITISNDPADFLFLPMSEYEEIPGVVAATRVGTYNATSRVGSNTLAGTFTGIDREKFADVAFWRTDFSSYRLGSLMNALGNEQNGLLIPTQLARSLGLSVGDSMTLEIDASGDEVEYTGRIVGLFDRFPTWYDVEEDFFVVGNLESFFVEAGNEFPYRVWMDTDELPESSDFRLELGRRGLLGPTWDEPHSAINASLARPERQGLFGLLSVGFVAATVLTVLGLLLYTIFSFQRRVVELGILRAVGLTTNGMTRLIAWELILLVALGLGLGTALGILVSQLFVPFLQVGTRLVDLIPSILVEISWEAVSQMYLLFGFMFLISLVGLVLVAMRMRVFMAIKLGETV